MVDIIVLVANRSVERMTMHNATSSFLLLEQGRKIEAESITPHIGGGAVNAAVAMARLGCAARALIKIGRDANGDRILERLAAEKVDDGAVLMTEELPTGTAVMVSSHDRNASIFTQRGTNTLLRPSDIDRTFFADRDLVYVANLSNRSADCFPLIVEVAREAGAFVAVNPGIRQLTSRPAALFDSLAKVDLIALNRLESEALVPILAARRNGSPARAAAPADPDAPVPGLMQLGLSFGGFDMGLGSYLDAMLRQGGVKRVLVTDGTEGAYLADGEGIHYCPADRSEVMGTAGAGDAFIATLATFVANGESLADSLRAAAVNAASVVSQIDTQGGLLSAAALAERVAAQAALLPITRWRWTA
jgi:ribokinase